MNKKFVNNFLVGFLSVFNFGPVPLKKIKDNNVQHYFALGGEDLNLSFEKLKNIYERERS